jgi:hypothetical protein
MVLEAKRFRHVAVAIPEVRVSGGIAVSAGQQSPESQQPDVRTSHRTRLITPCTVLDASPRGVSGDSFVLPMSAAAATQIAELLLGAANQ